MPHDYRQNPGDKTQQGNNIPVAVPPAQVNELPPTDELSVRMVSNRNQLLPGGMYKTDNPSGQYVNWSNPTNEWNLLEIEFHPPIFDAGNPTDMTDVAAALIAVKLNGHTVFDGPILDKYGQPAKGTGSRGDPDSKNFPDIPFVGSGAIYLQSHWGSQIEFRNPQIASLS